MKSSVFFKMLLSAALTVCLSVSAVGCGNSHQSSDSADTSDDRSASSAIESADNGAAESKPIEVVVDTSSAPESNSEKPESSAGEAESKTDKPESNTDNTESIADDTESIADDTESKADEPESTVDDTESRTDDTENSTDESSDQNKANQKESNGNIVVMLDPGHDDDESCSRRDQPQLGVNEQDLNLKIGLACYERLSEYEGITPYLTRSDGSCPNADKMFSGEYNCIEKRAYLAEQKDADFFVSLHCNATTGELGAQANGISVFITNYPEYHDECEKLGNMIIDHVTGAVDLESLGLFSEYKEEKGYYKDGTVKDKLFLLSYNVDNDRPAIVVEHAFMDNINDNAILRDDEKLRLIGQADADAIAEYYGLELK